MRRQRREDALDTVLLEQMLHDYWREIDFNAGRNVADYWVDDGIFVVGDQVSVRGSVALTAFYADWAKQVSALKSGVRTARHSSMSLRCLFEAEGVATLTFLALNFSGSGNPPLYDATAPTIISDARMECRRDAEGQWRIASFHAQPIFIGADPFLNKQIVTG
jgi:hypothetical protein